MSERYLVPSGAVPAQFVKPTDIIERGGHTYEITGYPLRRDFDGALVFSAFNELGGIEAVVIELGVLVQTYTEATKAEFDAYVAWRKEQNGG